jgi:uncharacterized protein (DUF1800 family)
MDDRTAIAWLHRRAGFGLAPAALDEAVARGSATAELDRLLGLATSSTVGDPWDDAQLPLDPRNRDARRYAITTWLDQMVGTTDPLRERTAWLWHGHFVTSFDKVRVARALVDNVRLLRTSGLGSFPALVRAVTTDAAMLTYLDGRQSTGTEPNENYAREMLELFTLGVGQYDEADVQAGARALTGWVVRPGEGASRFNARRHDDTPQHYLGHDGVHDVETVVAAVMAHPAMPTFITRTLALELLGAAPDDLVAREAAAFAASGFEVAGLVRALLAAGLDGVSAPIVLGPVSWLVAALRVTGATVTRWPLVLRALNGAGQVPMAPPNVAGWPGGRAWFASSTVVARANLAAGVAAMVPDGPVLAAAADADPDALIAPLGLTVAAFGDATAGALRAVTDPRRRLALALTSPEFVIA